MKQENCHRTKPYSPKSVSGLSSQGKTAPKDGAMLGFPNTDCSDEEIRQYSNYTRDGRPMPDNNPFWENGNNPLSSKGN